MLQSILNAAARLIAGIPKFSHRSSFIRNHFTDFLFVNASNSRSAPSRETVLLALLHNTSRLTVSQFLLYLVVPPFGLRLGCQLFVPRTRTSMTQSRSFAIVGPSNWNKLPLSLTEVRRKHRLAPCNWPQEQDL